LFRPPYEFIDGRASFVDFLRQPEVLFGIGCESMYVAQSAIVARWFTGNELAMAFGITLTIARLGTVFSFDNGTTVIEPFRMARSTLDCCCVVPSQLRLQLDLHFDGPARGANSAFPQGGRRR